MCKTKTQFLCQPTQFNRDFLASDQIKELRKYRPPLLVASSMPQLIWLTRVWRDCRVTDVVQKHDEELEYERSLVPLKDGGTLSIDWYWPDELDPTSD